MQLRLLPSDMVMSRLFQTKHHTLALAPYGGILLILFFSMLCLSRSVSHGFLSVVDFLYLHSHLFYLHPYSFLFGLCVSDVFQLPIPLFFILFFCLGLHLFLCDFCLQNENIVLHFCVFWSSCIF